MRGYKRDRAVIQINTDGGERGSTEQGHRAGEDEFQTPAHGSSSFAGELTRRSNRDRHCRQFNSEQGCPNGDSCNFLHDEQSRKRKSDAIILGPSGYRGRGSDGGGGGRGSGSAGVGSSGGNAATAGNGANSKPFDWKTIPCNNLQMTGYCPLGNKCDFAHGATELHRYGGGLMVGERRHSGSAIATGTIREVPSQRPSTMIPRPSSNAVQRPSNVIHRPSSIAIQRPSTAIQRPSTVIHRPSSAIQRPSTAIPSTAIHRPSSAIQRPEQRTRRKWPIKLNGIYGDWIDDSI